jgi:hypothetical protein
MKEVLALFLLLSCIRTILPARKRLPKSKSSCGNGYVGLRTTRWICSVERGCGETSKLLAMHTAVCGFSNAQILFSGTFASKGPRSTFSTFGPHFQKGPKMFH